MPDEEVVDEYGPDKIEARLDLPVQKMTANKAFDKIWADAAAQAAADAIAPPGTHQFVSAEDSAVEQAEDVSADTEEKTDA